MSAESELLALKQACKEGESPEEHDKHAVALAAAYAAFADAVPQASNPAPQGETTGIDAAVVVTSADPE